MDEMKPIPLTSDTFRDCLSARSDLPSVKKYDMTLNLTRADEQKTSKYIADQTPTPTTRLIRNCEEFGLFDDLKHVNPFEETFRQAIDGKSKSLTTQKSLELIKCNDDETLHTPILLHTRKSITSAEKEKDSQTPSVQASKVVKKTPVKKKMIWPKTVDDSHKDAEIIGQKTFRKIHPKPVSTAGNITNPIKEKIRQSLLKFQTMHNDTVTAVESVPKPTVNVLKVEHKPKSTKTKANQLNDSKANERNREAAKRYRSKQRILHDKLLTRNAQLEAEIVQLRHEFEMFKKAHEKCSITVWNDRNKNLRLPTNSKVLRRPGFVPNN